MRDVVKAMKALSDETRLRIFNVLLERECCVCEVMQALDISQTRASRNLGILHDAGFLKMRKEGLWALYSIDQGGMKEYYPSLVEAVRKSLQRRRVGCLGPETAQDSGTGWPGLREEVRSVTLPFFRRLLAAMRI